MIILVKYFKYYNIINKIYINLKNLAIIIY